MAIPGNSVFLALALCLPSALPGANAGTLDSWIPARWEGGPLELARRAKATTLPADAAVREAIANWYDTATLSLLDGSPVNCLLVTWSAGAAAELELRQQRLVKAYTFEAHKRGLAVLGLIYPGADLSSTAAEAAGAGLDGLVLDGEFEAEPAFPVVIPIWRDAASGRTLKRPIVAIQGVSPSVRNLADMGIRSGPSSEPWIESNVWLVRSFRLGPAWRPIWISHQPGAGSPGDYARCVADAAVAGGRWIVALDDGLRAGLRRHDSAAVATWQHIGAFLGFAEDHSDWRNFLPYGNLGIILDTAGADPETSDEYLKLVARRQTPYRLILRSQLSAASLAGFRAVLAAELAPPTEAERRVLQSFAEQGGLVVAGRSWGDPPKDEPYSEVPVGKGRVVVYQDPDPESVARDMRNLLSQEDMGVVVFNVPSVIAYASAGDSGRRLLVQLLNYSNSPAEAITIRVKGNFKTARLYMPEAASSDLVLKSEEGRVDVSIPKLALWGGVLLE